MPAFALALGHGAAAAGTARDPAAARGRLLPARDTGGGAPAALLPALGRRCARLQALCFLPLCARRWRRVGTARLAARRREHLLGLRHGDGSRLERLGDDPGAGAAARALLRAPLAQRAGRAAGRAAGRRRRARARPPPRLRARRPSRRSSRCAAGARLFSARFLSRQSEDARAAQNHRRCRCARCARACAAAAARACSRICSACSSPRTSRRPFFTPVHARAARARLRALHRADRRVVPRAHRDPARAGAAGAAPRQPLRPGRGRDRHRAAADALAGVARLRLPARAPAGLGLRVGGGRVRLAALVLRGHRRARPRQRALVLQPGERRRADGGLAARRPAARRARAGRGSLRLALRRVEPGAAGHARSAAPRAGQPDASAAGSAADARTGRAADARRAARERRAAAPDPGAVSRTCERTPPTRRPTDRSRARLASWCSPSSSASRGSAASALALLEQVAQHARRALLEHEQATAQLERDLRRRAR